MVKIILSKPGQGKNQIIKDIIDNANGSVLVVSTEPGINKYINHGTVLIHSAHVLKTVLHLRVPEYTTSILDVPELITSYNNRKYPRQSIEEFLDECIMRVDRSGDSDSVVYVCIQANADNKLSEPKIFEYKGSIEEVLM